jgi:hypothetical protein
MEHHADFAIPVVQHLRVSTAARPEEGLEPIAGRVIALGWWVDPAAADNPDHDPAGTLYLVVDPRRPRPMWVRESDLRSVEIVE